jgi:hypothetical protein
MEHITLQKRTVGYTVKHVTRVLSAIILSVVLGFLKFPYHQTGACGGAVVEALRYKPEGRGIDSR